MRTIRQGRTTARREGGLAGVGRAYAFLLLLVKKIKGLVEAVTMGIPS